MSRPSACRSVVAGIAILAAAAAAGCGGSDGGGTKTFSNPAVPVTFEYPSDYQTGANPSIARKAGNNAAFVTALGLDQDNLIAVETFDLNIAITPGNLDRARPELDQIVDEIADGPADGRRVQYAGLPGFEYTVDVSPPTDGQSRVIFLFDDKTEIELNCQSTPDKRSEVTDACNQMLSTLKKA